MRQLVLYGASGCHLCVVAKQKLARVQRIVPFQLVEVDVRQDPALDARYGQRIPVIAVDGQERLVSKVTEFGLLKVLLT